MHVLRSMVVAFSMFSAIPMPHILWDEKSMRHALIAFPLVGLLIGFAEWFAVVLCGQCGASSLMRALVLTALPLLVTGGIHLDGFCDTWDALSSHREPGRMRQILKDPHIGAFGVMHLALLLLATFVLWTEVDVSGLYASGLASFGLGAVPLPLICAPMLSRSLSGLSVASFPLAEGEGLARTFAEQSDKRSVRLGCAVIALLAAGTLVVTGHWAMVAAAVLVFAWYRTQVLKQFGGLSGDLCGWFVQTCELWMLAALYVTQVVGTPILGVIG